MDARPVARPNCPILEGVNFRGADMCMKEKLEEGDLDVLGVAHAGHRHWHEADLCGVSDAWLD